MTSFTFYVFIGLVFLLVVLYIGLVHLKIECLQIKCKWLEETQDLLEQGIDNNARAISSIYSYLLDKKKPGPKTPDKPKANLPETHNYRLN